MTEQQLTKLIHKYLSGQSSKEEKETIEQWYESFDHSSALFEGQDTERMKASTARSLKAIKEKIAQCRSEERPAKRTKKQLLRRIAAAATVLILVVGTVYFLIPVKDNIQTKYAAIQPINIDFKPGGNKAVLTLGNGQQVILDSTNKGLLSVQGNTKVTKLSNGLLAYNRQLAVGNGQLAKSQKDKVLYNTITTPRGGQYEIVLPDGSKVWLNAASSIKFPTAFTGNEREVEITGEVYFEISPLPASPKGGGASVPFIVKANGMEVQVLGTHFNVNAYDNETTTKTTLLKGAVKVVKGNNTVLLKPGQEAKVKQNGQIQLVKDANVNEAIAWKNNLFWFENDNVKEVMKQLSRWYDVDIKIEGAIPDLFTGSIPRHLPFSKVFEILQKTGSMHYKIENKKIIIVTP